MSVGCAGSHRRSHRVTAAATAKGLLSQQGQSGLVSLSPQEGHLKGQTGELLNRSMDLFSVNSPFNGELKSVPQT